MHRLVRAAIFMVKHVSLVIILNIFASRVDERDIRLLFNKSRVFVK